MDILYLNTLFDGGGAEKICMDLFLQFEEMEGFQTHCIVGFNERAKPVTHPHVHQIYKNEPLRIVNRLLTRNHSHSSLHLWLTSHYLRRFLDSQRIDLIHLHNLHGNYFGISDLRILSKVPLKVWTLHDFWTFTGHCCFPRDCDGWKNGCKKCPDLTRYTPVSSAKKCADLYFRKKQAFTRKGIVFVCPSYWMKQQAELSFLSCEELRVIYNGVDEALFVPLETKLARTRLGLPENKRVLIVIAAQFSSPQKGLDIFLESLRHLKHPESYHVVFAGGMDADLALALQEIPVTFTNVGYLDAQQDLNQFYSCGDIFVNPSRSETFGMVTVEAMMCGTPAVCFDVGPMREIVAESSGWLAGEPNPEYLAECIDRIFDIPGFLEAKSRSCRSYAVEKFSIRKMHQSYMELYEEMFKRSAVE